MAKSGTANFYNNVATQSLRFDDGSSAYLTRTPDSASNRRTFTWSGWAKRANVGTAEFPLLAANTDANNRFFFRFEGNLIKLYYNVSGTANEVVTVALYRDTSAWYHVVLAVDTTQGTDTNRIKIYVNGVQQTLTGTYIAENTDTQINLDVAQLIGKKDTANTFYDGYLSEVNFIDGLALTPTSFGEFKNGVWIPINTSGLTFGTNGFRLQFNQVGVGTASTSTIGADTSGNTNHWTSSGIVASDCAMPDSPENNFATLNPLSKTSTVTLSEGNCKAYLSASTRGGNSTIGVDTGKWYFEVNYVTSGYDALSLGIIESKVLPTINTFNTAGAVMYYGSNGVKYINGSSSDYGASYTAGDIIGVAIDRDADTVTFYKNNTSQGSITTSGLSGHLVSHFDNGGSYVQEAVWNFGQDSSFAGNKTAQGNTDANGIGDFYYDPGDYLALCTANLPEPTIGANSDTQADDHFNTVLYTGSASSPNAITGVGFQPDWVWIKKRAADVSHAIFDSSRGVTSAGATNKAIGSNRVDAEGNGNGGLSAFGSDGFTLVDGSSGSYPRSLVNDSATYVAWNWKANGGTATATISESGDNPAAVVQANPTAGFSLITYTGTGDAGTIAHGLGAVPKMMMIKNRDVADAWAVYHGANTAAPATDYLVLDTSAATADSATMWADTAPTDSVFTVHDAHSVNEDAKKYVAYVFAEVEGYSKFGSYTGNGNADGTFVFTGFRPAWIMLKSISASNWFIFDSKRNSFNVATTPLFSNSSIAEEATLYPIDFLSNGFKLRASSGLGTNENLEYIYMAFAESPFKYANAR